jgi:hypothetical protein
MELMIFIFNIAQLLMMAGMFYYIIVVRQRRVKHKRQSFGDDDDEGGLTIDDLPDIVLPPVDGVIYPTDITKQKQEEVLV